MNETQIGILFACKAMSSLSFGALICNFADRKKERELVTMVAYSMATLLFQMQIVALPSIGMMGPSMRFPFLLVCSVMMGFFLSSTYATVSAIALGHLKKRHGRSGHEKFGEERLWGAVSWAICSVGLGVVLDLPRMGIWTIYVGQAFFGCALVVTLYMFKRTNEMAEEEITKSVTHFDAEESERACNIAKNEDYGSTPEVRRPCQDKSIRAAAWHVIERGGVAGGLFLNLTLCVAAGISVVDKLLFLFLRNTLHASNFLCGISVVVTVMFEIPIFGLSVLLLERFGACTLGVIGCIAYSVRCFGYASTRNIWVVLVLESLHGVTFGAFHTASVAYISANMPTQIEATGQALLQALMTMGSIVGTGVGGYVMQHFGPSNLYALSASLVLIATLAFCFAEYKRQKRETIDMLKSSPPKLV